MAKGNNQSNQKTKKGFSQKEKLSHYTAVAKGEKAVKNGSKFSEAEQRAYARGQRDARNENRVIFAIKQKGKAQNNRIDGDKLNSKIKGIKPEDI